MTGAGARAAPRAGAGPSGLRRGCGGRVVPLVALALALALAVLLVLFIVFSSPEKLVPSATAPPPEEAPTPAAAPAQDAAGTEPSGAVQAAADAPGERARAIIAEIRARGAETDLQSVYAEAMRFREGGAAADAHLLLFFAARQGHAASARELARTYDPTHHAAVGGFVAEPSLAQAYKWYRLAADGGDGAALEALPALRARVEQAAAGGDEDASLLLSRWRS